MLTVVSDTHGTDSHRLEGRTLTAVREAELVVHAGDFTTEAVLRAFEREAGAQRRNDADAETGDGTERDTGTGGTERETGTGDGNGGEAGAEGGTGGGPEGSEGDGRDATPSGQGRVLGVVGNNDDPVLRARLPAERVVEWEGVRLVVVHGHEHDETSLGLLGRQEGADLVVVGHSHQPAVTQTGAVTVLNPGSHADPRWHRPAHAELEATREGLRGRLVAPDGAVLERFELSDAGRE